MPLRDFSIGLLWYTEAWISWQWFLYVIKCVLPLHLFRYYSTHLNHIVKKSKVDVVYKVGSIKVSRVYWVESGAYIAIYFHPNLMK